MHDGESRTRAALITFFPMFIATLSLVTSIYNGYLNSKFVDIIQRNVGRVEYMKTCKEIIDAYFQVKFRVGLIPAAVGASPGGAAIAPEQREAENAVSKFAALGTYLANLRDDAARERYTELSDELQRVVARAQQTPPEGRAALFEPADRSFAAMNDECIKSAKAAPM